MKEKFLNIILFLLSLCFLAAGVVLMFFSNISQVSFFLKNINHFFDNEKITSFFISFFGTFIFGWGAMLFLLIIFAVMDLKRNYLHGFIFWAFTFWAASAGVISFLHKFNFLLIVISIIYGILFLVFFLSIPLKSGSQKQSEPKL